MRKEEGMKLERSHITKDEYGDQIILMKRTITKGRTNQKQTDIVYDITENIVKQLPTLIEKKIDLFSSKVNQDLNGI